jgi:integrative and conjugative element protein (TIGR02256 family)
MKRGGTTEVTIADTAMRALLATAATAADGRETGGLLLGEDRSDTGLVIHRSGGPGPAAIREPGYFLRDLAHAQQLSDEAAGTGWSWICDWHTHPDGLPTPSRLDLTTYRSFLADDELAFRLFVAIVVVPGTDRGWLAPEAFTWGVTRTGTVRLPLRVLPAEEA